MAAAPWSCAACTFTHSAAEAAFLACAVCGTARPEEIHLDSSVDGPTTAERNPAQNDAAEARGQAQAAAGQKGQPSPSGKLAVEPRQAEDVARRAPRSCATVANLSDEQYCCVWGVEVYEDGWRPEVARALLAKVARHGQQGGFAPTPPYRCRRRRYANLRPDPATALHHLTAAVTAATPTRALALPPLYTTSPLPSPRARPLPTTALPTRRPTRQPVNPILRARGWRCKRLCESASTKWVGLCTTNGRADADAASTNIQVR